MDDPQHAPPQPQQHLAVGPEKAAVQQRFVNRKVKSCAVCREKK